MFDFFLNGTCRTFLYHIWSCEVKHCIPQPLEILACLLRQKMGKHLLRIINDYDVFIPIFWRILEDCLFIMLCAVNELRMSYA